jgi:hypothetical protein
MKHLGDFFVLCSGAHRELLNQCPSERSKYAGLGAAVFFTGLFAFLSASFAFYTVFDSYFISLGLGALWGLMIFNLDRYIVSSMRKEGNAGRELLSALPRVLIAIVISVVIAKPLELRIFQKEIEPELVIMEQQAFASQEEEVRRRYLGREAALLDEIAFLEKDIREKEQERDELLRIAREEADGTGGSRVKNLGPIYQLKKKDADKAEAEASTIRNQNSISIRELRQKVQENDSMRQAELRGLPFTKRNGLAARMEALARVKSSSDPIWMASFFIMLLLVVLETVPVLVKLISPRGPYDNLLKAEEFRFAVLETEQLARSSSEVRKTARELTSEEEAFVRERLDEALRKS